MGHMKDEMTGLAEEIRGLHDARTAFRSEIRNRVMDLRSGVRELRTGYRSARAQMARTMRSESRAFLADLQKYGCRHRDESAGDAAGVRGGPGRGAGGLGRPADGRPKRPTRGSRSVRGGAGRGSRCSARERETAKKYRGFLF